MSLPLLFLEKSGKDPVFCSEIAGGQATAASALKGDSMPDREPDIRPLELQGKGNDHIKMTRNAARCHVL